MLRSRTKAEAEGATAGQRSVEDSEVWDFEKTLTIAAACIDEAETLLPGRLRSRTAGDSDSFSIPTRSVEKKLV